MKPKRYRTHGKVLRGDDDDDDDVVGVVAVHEPILFCTLCTH